MPFKRPIPEGSSLKITYDASSDSDGMTFVRVLWIPKGGAAVPETPHAEVTPGQSASISETIPSSANCRWMELWVDLPDGTGGGTLTLEVDGKLHARDVLAADTLWTAMVKS
jgi:hypothetical protein